jgi:hypothetical protein
VEKSGKILMGHFRTVPDEKKFTSRVSLSRKSPEVPRKSPGSPLNLYGVVDPKRLLNREDPFSLPPFNIVRENESWKFHPDRLFVVGGYRFDGSRACIDRVDGQVHLFQKGRKIPSVSWATFDSWLVAEIARLRLLFDEDGHRIALESETAPPESASLSGDT